MASETALGACLRRDLAETAALRLRIGATDCAQLASGLTGMGPQFDTLREKVQHWGAIMLAGEKAMRELLAAPAECEDGEQ